MVNPPKLAPVILFTFNRPYHTKTTLEALLSNPEATNTTLYAFADGPRCESDIPLVSKTRDLILNANGFRDVIVIKSDKNIGLASSIINGVTKVLQEHGRAIIIEDDVVCTPVALNYFNSALNLYSEEQMVTHIAGYIPKLNLGGNRTGTFFYRAHSCWGWATWSRAWKSFEQDGQLLMQRIVQRNLANQFDIEGTYGFTKMLQDQIDAKNNSWAIRWYASSFLANGLALHPRTSVIRNIGCDGSGVHSGKTFYFETRLATNKIKVDRLPIKEDCGAVADFQRFYMSLTPTFIRRIRNLGLRCWFGLFRRPCD